MTAALRTPVQTLFRHADSAWQKTEVPGLEVQEVAHEGDRLIVIRQRIAQRPQGGGKRLLDVPGYKFQALRTNLGSEFVLPLQKRTGVKPDGVWLVEVGFVVEGAFEAEGGV